MYMAAAANDARGKELHTHSPASSEQESTKDEPVWGKAQWQLHTLGRILSAATVRFSELRGSLIRVCVRQQQQQQQCLSSRSCAGASQCFSALPPRLLLTRQRLPTLVYIYYLRALRRRLPAQSAGKAPFFHFS